MARINMVSVGVAVGVGAVDQFLEKQDNEKGRTSFKRWSSLARLAGSLGGYAMQLFDFYPELGRDLAQSVTPLLTKTVWAEVEARTGTRSIARRTSGFVPSARTGGLPERIEI